MPSWMVLVYVLSIGYVPEQRETIGNYYDDYDTMITINTDNFNTVALFGFGIELFNHVRIKSEMESYQFSTDSLTKFYPFRIDYTIGAELYDEGFSIGIKHECDHSVIYERRIPRSKKYISMETQIYLKLEGKIR
jgi:hypothetical protein